MIGLAAFAILVCARNPGFWGYLLRRPGALDGVSAGLWLSHGLWPLLLAIAAWASAWGLGRRAFSILGLRPSGSLDELAAAALGLGLLGQAVFFLGCAGGLGPAPLAAFAAAAAVLGLSALPRPAAAPRPRADARRSLAAGLLAFAAFHLIVVGLAPAVAWDARAYHLALPELYLRAGRLVEVPWLLHSHWPHLMEALYTLPLRAGRDGAAALIHAGACVLLAAGAWRAGGGWPAALLLAGQPALLRVAPTAHADGAAALFLFAAALALSRWKETSREGWLAAGGLLTGAAVSAKLFGAAGAVAWCLWLAVRARRPREALLFAACVAAVAGPWFLRTWWQTGDPVWPLLRLTPESAALAARNARTNLWSWPPPAWLLTHDAPGLLLLPLAGLAALAGGKAKARSSLETMLWLPAPVLLLLAFRQHEGWRYLIPVYAAAALAAGRFARRAFSGSGARRAAALALLLLPAASLARLTQNNELFAVVAPRPGSAPDEPRRRLFEERSVDAAAFYREARAVLPADARVLLFREVRGYGAGFDYLWGDPVNQSLVDYRRLDGFDALGARLRELGVGYVLDHEGSHLYGEDPLYYDARTLGLMSGFLRRRAKPILSRDGLTLHQLL